MKSYFLIAVALLASPSLFAQSSAPNYLLVINVANPHAVTFTATSNPASATDASHTFGDGFDLVGFYQSGISGQSGQFLSTSLTTGDDGAPLYDTITADDFSGSFVDLNIYTGSTDQQIGITDLAAVVPADSVSIEHFDTESSAFTGSAVFDFGLAENLPTPGTTGDIFAGYDGSDTGGPIEDDSFFSLAEDLSNLVEIGQYEVIPEPSQWSMLLLGAGGLFFARRFLGRKRA